MHTSIKPLVLMHFASCKPLACAPSTHLAPWPYTPLCRDPPSHTQVAHVFNHLDLNNDKTVSKDELAGAFTVASRVLGCVCACMRVRCAGLCMGLLCVICDLEKIARSVCVCVCVCVCV